VLAILAFVVNAFLPIAQGLYLISSASLRPMLRRWMVCQLLIFAFFVWWANAGYIRQLGGYWQELFAKLANSAEQSSALPPMERLSTGGARQFTMMALPYTFFAFSTGFSLGPSVRELQVSRSLAALWPHMFPIALCGLVFGSLFLLGLGALWRQPEGGKLLITWLVVPIVGALGISALMPSMAYNVRYVAMTLPAYIFILAAGITRFRRPTVQVGLMAAVLLINALSLANYYHNPRYSREDARSAAAYLESSTGPGDVIVAVGNPTALQYYFRGKSPIITWRTTLINDLSALAARLQEGGEAHHRVWLVAIRPWEGSPNARTKAAFDEMYRFIRGKELPGVEVSLYERRGVKEQPKS
jgi:hypothetical protein